MASLDDPDFWDAVSDALGTHNYTYDLNDASERLDVVQIVCQAADKLLGDPRKVLKERAEGYWRDAQVLERDGDNPMAVAYRAIADELRKAVDA